MKCIKKKREPSIIRNVFYKSLTSYMLNALTWSIGALVDGAVIGNFLGVDAFAAYGLIWPLTYVYSLIGGILSGGSRNLYTQYAGKGELKEANHVFSLALLMAMGLSLVMTVLSWIFLSPIAALLGASGENQILEPLVCSYLGGFIIGLPFDSGAKILSGYMGLDSDNKRTIIATIAMTITDIVLDLAVVLHFSGGMFLLGFATAIGQMVYFLILTTHFTQKGRMLHINLKGIDHAGNKIRQMIINGVPAGITRFSNAFCGIAVNRILCTVTTSGFIAAYGVHKSIGSLIGATYLGVADTVWTLSSIYYGEEDAKALNELQNIAFVSGISISGIAAVILFLFPQFFADIYIGRSNPETLVLAAQAIRMFAISIPMYLVVYLFDDYLMGTRKLLESNIFSFLLECGFVVPVVWIMVSFFGGRGAWLATPIFLIFLILTAFIYINSWKYGKNFHEKRLLLPPGFGAKAGAELNISATSMFEIAGMSRLAGLFCEENSIDSTKGYKLALCIEEVGNNIIQHGFSDGKDHSIDLRILAKKGEVILRVRDDCRPFNLMEQYQMIIEQEDITQNIGIRMIVRSSKSVQYLSTLSTNNLIIRL